MVENNLNMFTYSNYDIILLLLILLYQHFSFKFINHLYLIFIKYLGITLLLFYLLIHLFFLILFLLFLFLILHFISLITLYHIFSTFIHRIFIKVILSNFYYKQLHVIYLIWHYCLFYKNFIDFTLILTYFL